MAVARPAKHDQNRLANGPLTGVRRKPSAFVRTDRPRGCRWSVNENGSLQPDPVKRTALAFADASD